MSDFFQFDASFWVLIVMGCLSLVLSISFYLKFRVLEKLSKNVSINVFDKTFNVFDPYPEHRNVIHRFITLIPIFLVSVYFLMMFLVVKIFEFGLVLGLTMFILCLGFMMVGEAFEVYTNSNLFTKAIRNQEGLGEGDLVAIFLLKRTMPRLSRYYLLFATILFASFVMLPYIVPVVLSALIQVVGLVIESVTPAGTLTPYLVLLLFTITLMTAYIIGRTLKNKAFGFSSLPSTYWDEQFERLNIMAKWGEAPPYELSHRPVLEDPEVEERKRRAMTSKE